MKHENSVKSAHEMIDQVFEGILITQPPRTMPTDRQMRLAPRSFSRNVSGGAGGSATARAAMSPRLYSLWERPPGIERPFSNEMGLPLREVPQRNSERIGPIAPACGIWDAPIPIPIPIPIQDYI
jgi:hypothetical protein